MAQPPCFTVKLTPIELVDRCYQKSWKKAKVTGNKNGNSKNFPTYPWNIPQTPNQEFMKGFLSFGVWGFMGYAPGVCWGSMGFSWEKTKNVRGKDTCPINIQTSKLRFGMTGPPKTHLKHRKHLSFGIRLDVGRVVEKKPKFQVLRIDPLL